jgi:glycosyltransferase involved in cell wall biosynthesis
VKILLVHNAYRFRGGEDAVVESETKLLRDAGHEVIEYRRHSDEIRDIGYLRTVADTVWSRQTRAELQKVIHTQRPDLLHAHNTFPLISPSAFWSAADARLPVVLTLHNFRLLCPQAMLLRDGRVCQDCVGRVPWRAVVHGCYRDSRSTTAVLSTMLVAHRALGTWQTKVDRFIALNEFCRDKFIEGGLPADRIVVKPNFVLPNPLPDVPREHLLFVGRLSAEKGVDVLARAASGFQHGTLRVVGTGPHDKALLACPGASMLGFQDPAGVRREMRQALALVFPSLWFETFGLVMVEAFAAGTPVIASRLGAALSLVRDGETGLLVEPGNVDDLRTKMQWALEHPQQMAEMGRRARDFYLSRFTPEQNLSQLLAVYQDAMASSRARHVDVLSGA